MSLEVTQIMATKTPLENANGSLKYSTPAVALAGLTTVVINRLLQIPLTVEETAMVMGGLTVIYNYAIAFAVKKLL